MKKKLLLVFLIVLIVIFLIVCFFYKDENINKEINNTINKKDEYKITLTLNNIYYIDNKKFDSKIKYIEIKKNCNYKYENKLYDNNNLVKKSTKKNFSINYKSFFNKIKKIKCYKKDNNKYCKTRMKSSDAFILIYKNSKNNDIEEYTDVNIISSGNYIDSISFKVKDTKNNIYSVKLNFDFGLQNIK